MNITISFDLSPWQQSRTNLTAKHERPTITISSDATLPLYPRNEKPLIGTVINREITHTSHENCVYSRPTIEVHTESMYDDSWEGSTLFLVWIGEHGTWIAIERHEWIEGANMKDYAYAGPFMPCTDCFNVILKALGREGVEAIGSMNPETIQKLYPAAPSS